MSPTARHPLQPGSTVGILGAGQLGRMLALAAARLGLKTHIYSDETGPAIDVSPYATIAAFTDQDALENFARSVDIVTYEFENVPVTAAATVDQTCTVHPAPKALEIAQDRVAEKQFARALGLPVPAFADIDDASGFSAAIAETGLPAILKTRRLGYDGKGQARVNTSEDLPRAFNDLGQTPSILESLVPFEFEISVLVARDKDGKTAFYDCPINSHENGILRRSVVPAPISEHECNKAHGYAATLAAALDYVGVLAVEMFVVANGSDRTIQINEIAPRVHNSGHWTIEACFASQFENHIRAIAGWPLASTERHSDAEMINIIGPEALDWSTIAHEPHTALHLYAKNEARPGRKMGHMTRLSPRTGD